MGKKLKIYNTHIEVSPYEYGDSPKIEKMLSRWDDATFKYEPVAYFIHNSTLFLPRGISVELLAREFDTIPINSRKCDDYGFLEKHYDVLFKPKSLMQVNGIKFLTSKDEYAYSIRYSQYGLNLDTGDGKTFTTVYSILELNYRAIIIVNQNRIKKQWIDTFKNMTNFPESKLLDISGSKDIEDILDDKHGDKEIFLTTHQTIESFARKYDWDDVSKFFNKIRVAIKVVDESHKFFKNTLMIDYFSNTLKSFYLTATFDRSDRRESQIYKKAFQSLVRFGEETINYDEKRRHINFVVVYFRSKPLYGIPPIVRTGYGFSAYKYIDYELSEENRSLMKVLNYILDNISKMEGRTLITSPKIESAEIISDYIREEKHIPCWTIHSHNDEEDNNIAKKSGKIISSTIKSIGVGTDIIGLRNFIELEPMGSKVVASQAIGRLREFKSNNDEDYDTYFWYPVDLTIKDSVNFLERILPMAKKKCKKIIIMKVEV